MFIEPQLKLGEVDPSQIQFDLYSRDEITKLLIGIQHIYQTPTVKEKVVAILERIVPEDVDAENGRPGMPLWTIFVLGSIRLNSNLDYDKLKELADYHRKIREIIGHDIFDQTLYPLQTLKDNVRLLTPELLDEINQVVVQAGHDVVAPGPHKELDAKFDSFVVETDVHYPTDTNLLFDAVRKAVTLTAQQCLLCGLPGWRQVDHNVKTLKGLLRQTQRCKRSTSASPKKKKRREQKIRETHETYLDMAQQLVHRVEDSIAAIRRRTTGCESIIPVIMSFLYHARRQMDQIRRRVLNGETIPHEEKVFSVFEDYTEWICKGKAGVPFELGLPVAIITDQHGFILHHQVMQHQVDEQVAVSATRSAKDRFPTLRSCSYDKGCWSPSNRQQLEALLDQVTLPKKGNLSQSDKERETGDAFVRRRRQHAAVESAINAIENHGLDRCLDHGILGFRRYVALAVVARNLQILGDIIQKRQRKLLKRQQRRLRLAA
jgi:hypothetical protein